MEKSLVTSFMFFINPPSLSNCPFTLFNFHLWLKIIYCFQILFHVVQSFTFHSLVELNTDAVMRFVTAPGSRYYPKAEPGIPVKLLAETALSKFY